MTLPADALDRILRKVNSDKFSRFSDFTRDQQREMADLNEPKKETVRITLPPRSPENGTAAAGPKIARPPVPTAPVRPVPPPPMARPPVSQPSANKAVLPPPLKPPVAPVAGNDAAVSTPLPMPPRPKVLPPPPRVIPPGTASSTAGRPAIYPGTTSPGPKKETARINILPEPVAAAVPAVKMSKTQPLLGVPATKVRSAAVTVAATPLSEQAGSFMAMLDAVPAPVCWIIFGASALTLLIQIWNYLAA